jgi:hypothetical protein
VSANIVFALFGIALIAGPILQLFHMFKTDQGSDVFGIIYTRSGRPERFWLRFALCIMVMPVGAVFSCVAISEIFLGR